MGAPFVLTGGNSLLDDDGKAFRKRLKQGNRKPSRTEVAPAGMGCASGAFGLRFPCRVVERVALQK